MIQSDTPEWTNDLNKFPIKINNVHNDFLNEKACFDSVTQLSEKKNHNNVQWLLAFFCNKIIQISSSSKDS